MQSNNQAICFPGQGAHNAGMLGKYVEMPDFASHYTVISDVLGFSPLAEIEKNPQAVNSNSVSSLLTVLCSRLAFLRFIESGNQADYLSGYSVGQYTALHFAGCFDFPVLAETVAKRAQLMDKSFEGKQGSMLAIAGVPQAKIEELLKDMTAKGLQIWISNFNCFGQYSLAGEKKAIDEMLERAESLDPKRLVELPVGGAWHCPLLNEAKDELHSLLEKQNWNPPSLPVVNNVSGDLMPDETEAIKSELVKHVCSPVQWEKGIRTLIARGCDTFTEVGYGNVLTKFGFFIDRSLEYKAFSGEVQAVCAE